MQWPWRERPHKFAIFDFHFAPTMEFLARPYTFWAGIVGGCFLTTASHGTDQLMVQRLLSARDQRDSRKALLASWALVAFQFTLFLLIGILLWVYYGGLGQTAPAADRIYPQFLWSSLPPGLAGLAIAAILAAAMANLSAALNALSSTVVVDFLGGGAGSAGEAGAMRRARLATVAWAAVLVGSATRPVTLTRCSSRADDCLDSFGRPARRLPVGCAHAAAGRTGRHRRSGCRSHGGTGGPLRNPSCVYLVCHDWSHGDFQLRLGRVLLGRALARMR